MSVILSTGVVSVWCHFLSGCLVPCFFGGRGGLCPAESLSRGRGSLSRGRGSLSRGRGSLSRGRGSLSRGRGSLSRGGGLCPRGLYPGVSVKRGSLSKGFSVRRPPWIRIVGSMHPTGMLSCLANIILKTVGKWRNLDLELVRASLAPPWICHRPQPPSHLQTTLPQLLPSPPLLS